MHFSVKEGNDIMSQSSSSDLEPTDKPGENVQVHEKERCFVSLLCKVFTQTEMQGT